MKACRLFFVSILSVIILASITGCQKGSEPLPEAGRIQVVASIFPLYDFARQVGGEKVEVTLLLPPGVEPHSFEPRPAQMVTLQRADILLLTHPAMEPWAADLVKGVANEHLSVVDTSRGLELFALAEGHAHDHGHRHQSGKGGDVAAIDPHFWLDLGNAAKMVDHIAEAFSRKVPAQASYFKERAAGYKERLAALDARFRDTLAQCPLKIIVSGGHATFGYAARRYNLDYVSAYSFSPNAEPTPRELLRVVRLVRKHNLRFIFREELLEPRVAQALASETGAELLLLHGGHGITKDEFDRRITFIEIMEGNLKNLKIGLLCP